MEKNKIENSIKFKLFLRGFGVLGMKEYKTFTEEEQMICIREFLKRAKVKNPNDNILEQIADSI